MSLPNMLSKGSLSEFATLIWTNPNPISTIAAKTITTPNLKQYRYIYIEALDIPEQSLVSDGGGIASTNGNTYPIAVRKLNIFTARLRMVRVTTEGMLQVSDAFSIGTSTTNARVIPYKIWGFNNLPYNLALDDPSASNLLLKSDL